jgi:hypothetical protein
LVFSKKQTKREIRLKNSIPKKKKTMKLSKFLTGVALFRVGSTTPLLLEFCQKEESFNTTIPQTDFARESHVVADDPALLSNVPITVPIIISNSLKQSKDSSTILYASGKTSIL